MGRSLNKRNFGPPTAAGEIEVAFFNGTAPVKGWIVKQTGSKRFKCSDGTNVKVCYLTDKAMDSLVAREMSISVKNDAGVTKRVKKLSGRKLTHFDGSIGFWTYTRSDSDSKVQMDEAGTDTSFTGASNLGVPAVPVISAFTATPASVTEGDSSVLAWTVTGAVSLSINQGVGAVTGVSKSVTPAATTIYTLTATNAGGSATKTVTVTVTPP